MPISEVELILERANIIPSLVDHDTAQTLLVKVVTTTGKRNKGQGLALATGPEVGVKFLGKR